MRGTIVCSVSDSDEGDAALELGVDLSRQLGLRLVLAHVAEGLGRLDGDESATIKASRREGELLLARLAREYGVGDSAECRVAVGEPALQIGRIAADEAADMIVVGSRARRWPLRGLKSTLAKQLESETTAPVLIAPPTNRRGRKTAVASSRR